MTHLKRTDPVVCRRLVSITLSKLKKRHTAVAVADGISGASGSETLPEVNLFSGDGKHPAWSWIFPEPHDDGGQALVQAYEAFAEQPLGATRYPGRVAEVSLMADTGQRLRGTLNLGCDPKSWYRTAVRLVALAQAYEGSAVHANLEANTFEARLAVGATLRVSPEGIYSNFRDAVLAPVARPNDAFHAALVLEEQRVTDQVFLTLARVFRLDRDMLAVARGLRACVDDGQIHLKDLKDRLLQVAERHRKAPVGTLPTEVEQGHEAALRALSDWAPDMMRQLYAALVPGLFSSREFKTYFGSASQVGRRPREETLEVWVRRINERAYSHT